MTAAEHAIELLIIEESLNQAEVYASTLRNAGMAIHPVRVDTDADLLEHLTEPVPDLVLCSADGDTDRLKQRVKLCLETQADIVLILVYQSQDPDQLLAAMRIGARDVVSQDDPEHLQLVVKREFADLQTRRRLAATLRQLQESEERCTALTAVSRDAIAYVHEGMHVRANHVYLDMFGYSSLEEIEGLPILDMIAPEDLDKFKRFLRSKESEQGNLEIQCKDSNDKIFSASLEFSPAMIDGEPCTQIIIRDSTPDQQLEEKIRRISSQDSLTGLANRQHFMATLDETINRFDDSNAPVSLHYISIDNYREIRNGIGLTASDALLNEFAQVLKDAAPDNALLARFGDHTFSVLSEHSVEDSQQAALALQKAIESHLFTAGGGKTSPSCSIGIAALHEEIPSGQELINNAYQACQLVGTEGADRVSVFRDEEVDAGYGDSAQDSGVRETIEYALANDRFKQVYQPVVSLEGDSRELYAVLTRLINSDNEEIYPDDFIDIAIQSGQMASIDRWVIRNAAQELKSQREQGRKINFYLTLSSSTLEDDAFLLWFCDCLDEIGIPGTWLIFQINESDIRSHLPQAKQLIEGLKKMKCQVAIGQYGTQENSSSLLSHLTLDYVRFHQALLDNLANSQEKQDRLSAMNGEAQAAGVKTMIMGVEDANSLALLWTVGVNYIQGYFLQEPSEQISYEFGS